MSAIRVGPDDGLRAYVNAYPQRDGDPVHVVALSRREMQMFVDIGEVESLRGYIVRRCPCASCREAARILAGGAS